jgi:hypothetical protein
MSLSGAAAYFLLWWSYFRTWGEAVAVCPTALACVDDRRHSQQMNIPTPKQLKLNLDPYISPIRTLHLLQNPTYKIKQQHHLQHGNRRSNQRCCKSEGTSPMLLRKSSPAVQQFSSHLHKVLDKLQKDPLSITTEDARRLSENYEAHDVRSAKIISAVESLAVAAQEIHEEAPSLGQGPQTSLLTVVNDLKGAVDAKPEEVTNEVLKTTQGIVSSKTVWFSSSRLLCSALLFVSSR